MKTEPKIFLLSYLMYSHHHEVELAVSRARGFEFKGDAAKLCPRLARHGGGEPDGGRKGMEFCHHNNNE